LASEASTSLAPDTSLAFVARLWWPDGVVKCPRCQAAEATFLSTRRLWKCRACKKQFSAKVGTIESVSTRAAGGGRSGQVAFIHEYLPPRLPGGNRRAKGYVKLDFSSCLPESRRRLGRRPGETIASRAGIL
jgi:Transposase zinc-ribbon domain